MLTSLFTSLYLTSIARRTFNYSPTNISLCRSIFVGRAVAMANSKFSYVRNFERDDKLPSQQWIVISLENLPNDFSKLFLKSASTRDNYTDLIRTASFSVMSQFKDIKVAYINFNKIHFVLAKDSTLYQRRSYKLLTYFGSCLTASFERSWSKHFTEDLEEIPYFDGHIHLFPNDQLFRDYFTKQQLAHHRVNLQQTIHLAIQEHNLKSAGVGLVAVGGSSEEEINTAAAAPTTLQEVLENEKESYYNEVLFANFGINYNNEPEIYKKGCVLLRQRVLKASVDDPNKSISDMVERMSDFLPEQTDTEASDDTIKVITGTPVGKRAEFRRRQKEKEAATAGKSISEVVVKIPDFKLDSFWLESCLMKEETSFNSKCAGLQNYAVGEWLLPHTWIVVRIDGKAFHKLSKDHNFDKPNDLHAINLMNIAAAEVMKKMSDIVFCFGESDEYSFVVNRYSKQSGRYSTSLVSQYVTLFTSAYVSNWPKVFDGNELKYEPMFDGRAVLYPTNISLRDYLSWRQADCHINNMYNTVFWKLIQLKGLTNRESEQLLQGTFSVDKRRILMDMGIDYDLEPAIHRKGSILYRIPEGKENLQNDLSLVSSSRDTKKSKSSSNTNESSEKPWWNSDCEDVKLQRKNIRKKCQLQPTVPNFEELKECEALAKKIFKSAKQNFARQSNTSNPVSRVKSASCSKCGSSDLMPGTLLDHSKDVCHTARNRLSSTSASNVEHGESASDAVLNAENGSGSLPTGFDKRGNPWWNVECHEAKTARTAAKSAFMKSPNAITDKCFKDCEVNLKAAIKTAKKEYKKTNSSGQTIGTESNQSSGNLLQTVSDEVTLEGSRVDINGDNVERVNGFSNDDYKVQLEMLASTLREGLSGTPAMPTDVHSELYAFDNSSSTQLLAYGDTSKGVDVQTDDFIKFTNGGDDSTLLNVAQSDALDESSGVAKSDDRAFLFGDIVVADSGYSSSSLKEESGRECNEHAGQSSNLAGDGDTKPVGCGENKTMGGNICLCHVDIIKDDFWNKNTHILGQEKSTLIFDE